MKKSKMPAGSMKILKRILTFTKPYKKYLVLTIIFASITAALTLYAPILIGNGVDKIFGVGEVDFDGLIGVLIKLAIIAGITALSQWLMNLCTNKITYNTVKDIRKKAFDKLQIVPLKYIDSHRQGEIISRIITDVDQISDGLLMGFTQLFSGVAAIIGTFAFMLSINPFITLIVVLITPVSFLVAAFIAGNSFRHFNLQSKTRGEMTSLVEEMIGNQKLVKAFGYENRSEEKFDNINQNLRKYSIKAIFISSLTNPSTRFVNGLVYAGVGVFGAITAMNGGISVGQLTSFLSYANQYTKPFNEISGVITELQSALSSAQRVFEIIDAQPQEPDKSDSIVLTEVDGSVKLENVSFSYSPEVPLIENFNLDVKSGQRIAVVGPTGCGKTTLINLLMRFYDINSGKIIVSGNNVENVTRDSLRSMYGMVLQETWLKKGTIAENIAYGNPEASIEEIIAASKAAHAHSFIERLPNGYDSIISDDETNISQGQKQLLCIARVMLCLPPMLILDEATSSIDTRTELQIQKGFANMMKGRTSFIVAHRLSTIREADCIIMMKSGHIVELGTHEQLLANMGDYYDLYNSQFANQ